MQQVGHLDVTHHRLDRASEVHKLPDDALHPLQLLANLMQYTGTLFIRAPQFTLGFAIRHAERCSQLVGDASGKAADSGQFFILLQAGLQYAHHDLADVFSCNIGDSARLIEYLFYSRGINAQASVRRRIDGRTILPSAEEPSDHIAIVARVDWQS